MTLPVAPSTHRSHPAALETPNSAVLRLFLFVVVVVVFPDPLVPLFPGGGPTIP